MNTLAYLIKATRKPVLVDPKNTPGLMWYFVKQLSEKRVLPTGMAVIVVPESEREKMEAMEMGGSVQKEVKILCQYGSF